MLGGNSKGGASSSGRGPGGGGGQISNAGGSNKRPPPGGRGARGSHPQALQNNGIHYTPRPRTGPSGRLPRRLPQSSSESPYKSSSFLSILQCSNLFLDVCRLHQLLSSVWGESSADGCGGYNYDDDERDDPGHGCVVCYHQDSYRDNTDASNSTPIKTSRSPPFPTKTGSNAVSIPITTTTCTFQSARDGPASYR